MNKRPKLIIAGITGQDGSYLAELLLSKGYEVHGIKEDQVTLIQLELMIFIKIDITNLLIYSPLW